MINEKSARSPLAENGRFCLTVCVMEQGKVRELRGQMEC